MLEAAALMGMPMRPEHVQDLMRSLNQPKIACTHPDESDRSDGPFPFPVESPQSHESLPHASARVTRPRA